MPRLGTTKGLPGTRILQLWTNTTPSEVNNISLSLSKFSPLSSRPLEWGRLDDNRTPPDPILTWNIILLSTGIYSGRLFMDKQLVSLHESTHEFILSSVRVYSLFGLHLVLAQIGKSSSSTDVFLKFCLRAHHLYTDPSTGTRFANWKPPSFFLILSDHIHEFQTIKLYQSDREHQQTDETNLGKISKV